MGASKWQVVRPLGEGGTGQVWLVRTPEGGEVAVKLLSSHEHLPLWEHEVRLLMRMRHPAIAPILGCLRASAEIFGENRGPCFWMEFVPGDDLLKAAESRGRDPETLQGWFVQGLQALAYLHSQDVLHGDLSPGNLRVAPQTGLRLIDFGTASLAGSNAASKAATLLYLAPEKIGGKNGPACDLFAFGTLFYEALAGVHPRACCRSLSDMIRKPARPLLEVRPDLEKKYAVLSRVLDRMILADPAVRFSQAHEVLEALSGRSPEPRSAQGFYSITMFGAAEALDKAARALETLDRRSHLMALHGVTGVGKKRFLREIGFQGALAGRSVTEVPPVRFRQRMENLKSAEGVLLFRSLDQLATADLAALLKVNRKSAPEKGCLIVWEWNDDALREDSRRVLENFSASPDVTDIVLKNLDETQTRDLVRSALAGGNVVAVEETAARLYRSTGGNPHLLLESLRSPESSDLRGVLENRLRESPPLEMRILELLAAARDASEADALFRAVGGEALDSVLALDRLSHRGLVAVDAGTGRYRLRMSGLRDVLFKNLSPEVRAERHRAWWEALSGEGEASAERLHHALALGDAAYAARWAHPIVERLWKEKDTAQALAFADAALALVRTISDDVETSKLLRMKVNLLNELGRYAETLDLCEEILRLRAADEVFELKTVKYWLITGMGHQNLGNAAEAERRFRRCLEECEKFGGAVPRTYAMRCHSLIGMEAMRRGDLTEARRQFEAGLGFTDFKGWRRAEICRNLAVVCHKEGDVAGAARLLDEARALYAEEANDEGVYATWLQEGNLCLEHDDFPRAERAYAEAEKIAERRKDELLLASVWNNEGLLERRRGDLARSLDRLQKALGVFRPLGNWIDLAESLKQNAVTEISLGRFEEAETKIEEIIRLSDRLPQAAEKADEAREQLLRYRDGQGFSESPESEAAERERLMSIHARLPKALQVRFEERFDYKKLISRKGR